MGKREFDDFLKKEEQKKKPPIDWEAEKKKWFEHLNKLFSDVKIWLNEYVDAKKIKIEFNNIDIHEEAIGTYTVKELRIFIGDKIAKLTPIGTILIGTKGRADLSGNAGTVKFILADKNATGLKIEFKESILEKEKQKDTKNEKKKSEPQINWVWKITSNPPRIKYTDLNQDTFLQCLMEVING
jgi:hypothetical protein